MSPSCSRLPGSGLVLAALTAGAAAQTDAAGPRSIEFQRQWHAGEAELSRFDLEQARYGGTHRGQVVLIFVTEDFRADTQVKSERGAVEGTVSVLKLNEIRRFVTGVYDYSMMRSVFTPADVGRSPRTLKVTTSVQDWCGQVWNQLNLRGEDYAVTVHSYFEQEADERYEVSAALLEDELWTRIRLAPATLPDGDVEVIPSGFDARLRHYRLRPMAARAESAEVTVAVDGRDVRHRRFTLRYPDMRRSLSITFEAAFPYRIQAFEETVTAADGKESRTRAKRTHLEMLDYWNHHDNDDLGRRAGLGLDR